MFLLNGDEFDIYKQTFRTLRPPNSKEIPLPEIISVSQVEGTNYLEITFRINDADSSHVEAAYLDLLMEEQIFKIVVPKSFIGSIEENWIIFPTNVDPAWYGMQLTTGMWASAKSKWRSLPKTT